MSTTISVVIPVYNSEKFIEKAVHSVVTQELLPDEIIIVDDGSTDTTQSVIERIVSNNKKPQPQIKHIRQKNQGPAIARNTGIKNAFGDYIAFLDADDQWLPTRLRKQIEIFCAQPDVGLVCSGRFRVNEATEYRTQDCVGKKLSNDGYRDLWTYKNYITTSSVLVKKKCFVDVGYFDENPRVVGSEDIEMWLRIAEKFTIIYINEPLVEYLVRQEGINRSNIQRSYESAVFIFKKHEPEFRRRYKDASTVIQNKWGRVFQSWGITLFDNNQFNEAKEKFKIALTFQKFSLITIRFYLLTLLGQPFLLTLKRWKKSGI